MIYSMTGYGRASAVLGGREITVELRSVNALYFEYTSRIPRSCAFLDSRLKALLASRIARGKVEVSLTLQDLDASETAVAVDMDLARSYQQALRDMSETLGVKNDVTAGLLARFPDVLVARQAEVDEERLWADVSAVAAQAVENFVELRGVEGEEMVAGICGPLDAGGGLVGRPAGCGRGHGGPGRGTDRRPGGKIHPAPVRAAEGDPGGPLHRRRPGPDRGRHLWRQDRRGRGDRPAAQPHRPVPGDPGQRPAG